MDKNPVGWFELPVSDIERAQTFYEKVLEIKLKRKDIPNYKIVWFPHVKGEYGISGALMEGDGYHPAAGGVVIYFPSDDIEAGLKRAVENGGKVFLHKKDIGPGGFIGWFVDTEGNIVGLHTAREK